MSDTPAKKAKAAPLSFEQTLADLEKIIADMESGELSLADSLVAFKRGNELMKLAQAELQGAEQTLKLATADGLQEANLGA
jgi:exodeoxyribonuclease VII small subunit